MKRYRGVLNFAIFLAVCAGLIGLVLHFTAHYPALGETVSYPVNEVEGFTLSIQEPGWSPFRGYTLRYKIDIDSEKVYTLTREDSKNFEGLEYFTDGQWHRLLSQEETVGHMNWDVGGEGVSSFQGSIVQKFAGYGTRLESGTYRLTMELTDQQGSPHYLAAEFTVK